MLKAALIKGGLGVVPNCYRLDVAVALFFPLFLLGRSRNASPGRRSFQFKVGR